MTSFLGGLFQKNNTVLNELVSRSNPHTFRIYFVGIQALESVREVSFLCFRTWIN